MLERKVKHNAVLMKKIRHIEKNINQSINQSLSSTRKQTIKQSIDRTNNQSISQSVDESIGQSTDQSINRPDKQHKLQRFWKVIPLPYCPDFSAQSSPPYPTHPRWNSPSSKWGPVGERTAAKQPLWYYSHVSPAFHHHYSTYHPNCYPTKTASPRPLVPHSASVHTLPPRSRTTR